MAKTSSRFRQGSMMRRIIIVGDVGSIHLARWLRKFKNLDAEFTIFPTRFSIVHPELLHLEQGVNRAHFFVLPKKYSRIFGNKHISRISNRFEIYELLVKYFFQVHQLREVFEGISPQIIHLHSLHQSSRVYINSKLHLNKEHELFLTNWGSDVIHFGQKRKYRKSIRKVMERANWYNAECRRDYPLVSALGFKGEFGECFPTAFSFQPELADASINTPHGLRPRIAVKCNTGSGQLEKRTVELIQKFLIHQDDAKVLLYSVPPRLKKNAKSLESKFPGRVKIFLRDDRHSNNELMAEFLQCKIHLGLAISDGLSTGMLEAMNCGCIPIQSDTSCCAELKQRGYNLYEVSQSGDQVLNLMFELWNSKKFDQMSKENFQLLKRDYSSRFLEGIASRIYSSSNGEDNV